MGGRVASCRAPARRARLLCLADNREILLLERDLKYDADQRIGPTYK
jgi:hypothetical protein